jgi:uncharacterized Ntn-hydrolase superfamily protein
VTYSIVARDPETGQLGVAVQSCWFSVGSVVTWAEPGVGAVATQAMAERAYGPRCLAALRTGDATSALAAAIDLDDTPELRQVAVVGADGSVAAHTGSQCIQPAGHVVGDGFSAQANLMANDGVWDALADGYLSASGALSHRLLAGLDAAQAAGGDARGVMSAALLVVDDTDVVVELRVEHHDGPLGELRRLLTVQEAFALLERAENEMVDGDPADALAHCDEALRLVPGDENARFTRAGVLLLGGQVDAGRAEIRGLVADNPSWEVAIRGFAALDLVPLPDGLTVDDLFA